MFKLSESLPTNSIKVLHLTNKIVGWTALLGSEKVYWENEKYPFSKILQDFGKELCNTLEADNPSTFQAIVC